MASQQTQQGPGEKQKKMHKIDKVILDLFWTLAEGNDVSRVTAAEKLCQRIVENKSKDADSGLSQQNYCLQRLIRGLSSTRKFARVGYAVALTKLLRTVKDIKVKAVMEAVVEELKVAAHDPKSEVGNKLMGQVFAYGALVQSERKLKPEQVSTVVRELVSLGEKKSYIRPLCTQTLVDLVDKASSEQLAGQVWPLLRADLEKGWEECPPDRFLLLLACRRKDKTLVNKEFLQSHWGASKIVGKKNLDPLLRLLMRSVETPQLQSALMEAISQEVTRKEDNAEELSNFWTKVGNPLLASTVPRKQIAMSLFCQLLEHSVDLSLVQKMLFPAVALVICKTSEKKDEQLTDICTKAETLLAEMCKKETEGGSVLDIVRGFLHSCRRLKSYEFLRSSSFSTIVGSLQGQSVKDFTQTCMDCLMGRGDLSLQEEETDKEDSGARHERFCQQLVPLLRVAAVSPGAQQSGATGPVLQFLLLHTFFRVSKATKDIPQCDEVSPELSPTTRSVCQATFYRALMQLLSTRPERFGEDKQVLNYIRVLTDLALFVEKLLSNSKSVQPVKEISEAVREEWQTVIEIVKAKAAQKRKSTSGSGSSSTMGETEAFTLLILHLAFDLFTEPESTTELLQDIYVCRQKAVRKQTAKRADDGEPQWVEVITEILLSMLSRASKLARKTTVAVFKSLSSHLNPAAVHLITEVLKSDKSKKEEDLFEFEDTPANGDANEDRSEDEESEDDDEEDMEVDEDSDESDDDEEEEEEEEDGKVDEELRRSVKAALGSAAVASDDEDEDEEEEELLSDSEMFKLDEQLAAAFRSMKRPSKKEKKEKRREVASFRLRALDLLEVIVKGDRCGDFVLELLAPLLNLVRIKFRGQGQGEGQPSDAQQLCNRATELFHILCKQRNLVDHLHDRDETLETTRSLLQMAQSGSNPQFATEIANGCLCIMRLMSHQGDTSAPSPVKTRAKRANGNAVVEGSNPAGDGQDAFVHTIQSALEEDLVARKNSRYNMAFFNTMVQKYPNVFWPLVSTAVKCLGSPDTKVHSKTQTCSLLVQLLRLNKRDSLSEEQWTSVYSSVPPVLKKLVQQQKEGLKSGLLLEVLNALFHLAHMAGEEKKTVLSGEVMTPLSQLKGSFNKDTRRAFNKITQLLSAPGHKNKKGKKRKHKEMEKED